MDNGLGTNDIGGGVLGGVLGSALLGNNGLLNRNGNDNCGPVARTSDIAATERLLQGRFDAEAQRDIIKAVENTAAATQLAQLAQANALGVLSAKGFGEANTQIALTAGATQTQGALNAAAIQTQSAKQAGDLSTQIALNTAAVATAVERTGTANAIAFKDAAIQTQASTSQVLQSINADGEKTRELITRNYQDTLNRQLSDANNIIAELRNEGHSRRIGRETEVNVTQTVNQNQAQLQAQQQQQQQAIINERLCCALAALQQATATNQQLIIGNTGAVLGGPQTANPTNVRA